MGGFGLRPSPQESSVGYCSNLCLSTTLAVSLEEDLQLLAYLDWKFRHEQQDNPEWHKRFFDHMRDHIGFYANWNNPIIAFLDSVVLVFFVILVSVVLPIVNWFPWATPVALLIDLCFGNIMRESFTCARKKSNASKVINENCLPVNLPIPMGKLELVFAVLIGLFLVSSIFTILSGSKYKHFGGFLRNVFGFVFLMVFLPWFIEEYLVVTPLWLNGLIIAFSLVIWLGFPPLRDKSALALIIYFYAYTVKWQVFKTPVLGLEHSMWNFSIALWISGLLLWLSPFLGSLQQGAIHAFNRYVIVLWFNCVIKRLDFSF